MKTSEFIKQIEELGYHVYKTPNAIFIENENKQFLANVSIRFNFVTSTDYYNFTHLPVETKHALYNLVHDYASTAIEDREDEKRFYVKVPENWNTGKYKYFTWCGDEHEMGTELSGGAITQFTEKEIKHYHLENFEKVEVKQ